jgi:hypothetical protein
MARATLLLASTAILALLGAGCVGNKVGDDAGTIAPAAQKTFHMDATGCEQSGWIAMYPMPSPTKLAGVWEQTDIRAEYGNPIHDSVGSPSPLVEPQNGNIHMGFHCATATVNGDTKKDFMFGAILQMIKAPDWDPGGADVNFLISGISFQNGTFADALRNSTNADITHTAYSCTVWYLEPQTLPAQSLPCPPAGGIATPRTMARSYAYTVYYDVDKGRYQSWGEMAKYRDVPTRTVRFWWQVPADGSQAHIWDMDKGAGHEGMPQNGVLWHPMYWDLVEAGGGEWTTPPEGEPEFGEHNLGIPVGEHGAPFSQPLQQVFYEHPTLTFTSGHVIQDVTLDKIWMH